MKKDKDDLKTNIMKEIYRIDHYYNLNHNEQCLLIETDLNKEHIIKLISALCFKFEEFIDNDGDYDEDEKYILKVLTENYNVINVKSKYIDIINKTYPEFDEWENCIYMENLISINQDTNIKVIQIDLYKARDSCLGLQNKIQEELLTHEAVDNLKEISDIYLKNK